MVSLQVNEYVMTSNEIATEFCGSGDIKGLFCSGKEEGKKHSIESGRRKEGQNRGARGEGRRDTILNAAPSLSHTFSPSQ